MDRGVSIRTTGWILIGLSCWCSAAFASGIGPSVEYAHTWGDFNGSKYEGNHGAINFMYDSNVATAELFNYRLQAGFQFADYDDGTEGYGLGITNTFGFGLYRGPGVRLWVGPSIRFGVDGLDVPGPSDITELKIGGGPQLGANWHLNEGLSLTTTISYDYLWVGDFCNDHCHGDDFEDGSEHRLTINVGLLFRTPWDVFGR